MENFRVIIVEDVPLELKGTEGIFRNEIPEAEIIGTAESEVAYWKLIKQNLPDLVLLDLGLGGSTTVGVEVCRQTKQTYPHVKVLIFTGEILNEKLWVDVLDDPRWERYQDLDDVEQHIKDEIEHFFVHYKDLEPNKEVTGSGWGDKADCLGSTG